MTRGWADFLAFVDAVVSLPLVLLLLFLASIIFGVLHYFYPRWIPRRWPSFLVRTPKTAGAPTAVPVEPVPLPEPDEEVPDLPAHVFASLADRLAAEGRFAEAVRERLRAIVRGLAERGILDHQPGMTVTELARAAATVLPVVDPPLSEATRIFSDIWYGQRTATAGHDDRMRQLAGQVDQLAGSRTGVGA